MGLFSFLKDAGAKLLGRTEEAPKVDVPVVNSTETVAEAEVLRHQKMMLLRGVIDSLGLGVNDLEVDLNDDKVTVYGSVDTEAEKEKVVLALGNVAGICTVDERLKVSNPEPAARFHTVVKGDTLSKIAKEFYGDAMKYPEIFEANKPMLKDPSKIYPGQLLRIPNL